MKIARSSSSLHEPTVMTGCTAHQFSPPVMPSPPCVPPRPNMSVALPLAPATASRTYT
jgi:hypothetical protein